METPISRPTALASALWQTRSNILYPQHIKRHEYAKLLETIVYHIQLSKNTIHASLQGWSPCWHPREWVLPIAECSAGNESGHDIVTTNHGTSLHMDCKYEPSIINPGEITQFVHATDLAWQYPHSYWRQSPLIHILASKGGKHSPSMPNSYSQQLPTRVSSREAFHFVSSQCCKCSHAVRSDYGHCKVWDSARLLIIIYHFYYFTCTSNTVENVRAVDCCLNKPETMVDFGHWFNLRWVPFSSLINRGLSPLKSIGDRFEINCSCWLK